MASPNGEVAFFVPSFQCLLSPLLLRCSLLHVGYKYGCVCVFFICRYPQLFGFYDFYQI